MTLLEKLLVPLLAKLGNLVVDGGIWMNTQRPEWNDANNALVGYGLSMVTLGYLRRYLLALRGILDAGPESRFDVSAEVVGLFEGVGSVLRRHVGLLEGPVGAEARKSFMDDMGAVTDRYRASVYGRPSGAKAPLGTKDLQDLVALAMRYLDHTLALARRDDGLFHSYNLARFDADCLEQCRNDGVPILRPERQRAHPQRQERVERMERGPVQRDAEQRGLAQVVLAHPQRLGHDLRRPELAVRLEQPREQHRHRLDRVAVLGRKLGQPDPREVCVRRNVVEVEPDGLGHGFASVDRYNAGAMDTSTFRAIRFETLPGDVLKITIAHPTSPLNTVDALLHEELTRLFRELKQESEARAVLRSGRAPPARP